ncbi:unnamed protein product, partial [Staurois parvus]
MSCQSAPAYQGYLITAAYPCPSLLPISAHQCPSM